MDDLRYQVDLLTAMNQKLTGNEKMYNMICEGSQRAFLYINYVTNSIRQIGRWENFGDFRLSDSSDLSRLSDIFDESAESELRNILFLEKENRFAGRTDVLFGDKKTWIRVEVLVHMDETGLLSEKLVSLSDVTVL